MEVILQVPSGLFKVSPSCEEDPTFSGNQFGFKVNKKRVQEKARTVFFNS